MGTLAQPWTGGVPFFLIVPSPHEGLVRYGAALDPGMLQLILLAVLACVVAVSGLVLFRRRMFDLPPVAYSTVVSQLREGMLLLDARDRIVDLNPAAQRILGMSAQRALGQHGVQLLLALAETGDGPERRAHLREIRIEAGMARRHYSVDVSPIQDRRGRVRGSIVLLRDITAQKRTYAHVIERHRAAATLRERDRVARELHDNLGQVLGFVKMHAQAARHVLARERASEADSYLARLAAAAQDANVDVREYIAGARAAVSVEGGFLVQVQQYVERFREVSGIVTTLTAPHDLADHRFDPMVETQLFCIIQEALTNIRKHSGARHVDIQLSADGDRATATILDDGEGFELSDVESADGQRFGLRFMRERAQEVGGSVSIRTARGHGVEVAIQIPLQRSAA